VVHARLLVADLRLAEVRKAGRQEGTVIVGEVDLVLALDPGEFRISKTWPDLADSQQGQPPGRSLAERHARVEDRAHPRKSICAGRTSLTHPPIEPPRSFRGPLRTHRGDSPGPAARLTQGPQAWEGAAPRPYSCAPAGKRPDARLIVTGASGGRTRSLLYFLLYTPACGFYVRATGCLGFPTVPPSSMATVGAKAATAWASRSLSSTKATMFRAAPAATPLTGVM
jgi:hypothetical protein